MDQTEFWDDYQHLKREVNVLRDSVQRLNIIRGRFQALMDSPGAFVAFFDSEGRFLEINLGGLALLGLNATEVIDQHHVRVLQDEPSRSIGAKASEAIRSKQAVPFVWKLTSNDGIAHTLNATATPVRDERGTVVAACVVAVPQSS